MKKIFLPLTTLVLSSTLSCQTPAAFVTTYTYALGVSQAVSSADFDGDGKKDIVVAQIYNSVVEVFKGNGDGTFNTPISFTVGTSPWGIWCADINSDTKPDILTCNYNSNNISVLLGLGNGSFSAVSNYNAGTNPYAIVAGNFNGDNLPDVACCNFGGTTVSVFLGTGGGVLSAATNYNVGFGPIGLVCRDIDGDGDADFVVGNHWANSNSILTNNGQGVFSTTTYTAPSPGPYHIFCEDFNSDGNLDVMSLNSNAMWGSISMLQGNGTGTFIGSTYTVDPGPFFAGQARDFDMDSKIDFVTSYGQAPGAHLFPGNGDGTFSPARPFSDLLLLATSDIWSDDFNGDAKPDLAFVKGSSNASNDIGLWVMLNQYPTGTGPGTTTAVGNTQQVQNALQIVPNPFANSISISLDRRLELAGPTFNLFDITGQQLLEARTLTIGTPSIIDLEELQRGVYIIQLMDQGRVISTKKIIKL